MWIICNWGRIGLGGANIDLVHTPLGKYAGDLDTRKNTENIDDLFIDTWDLDNSIGVGQGNDFVYSGGGNDFVSSGAGDDFLDGGADKDILDYSFDASAGEAGPEPDQGIVASIGGAGATIKDTYGDTDTVVNFEEIWGSGFDDVFEVEGDLAAVALQYENFSADGVSDHEEVGDTLILTTTNSATVNLETNVLENGDESITVSGFENVVGSGNDDSIAGDFANNILVGGDGTDAIDGGAGDDILVVDADDLSVDGNVQGGDGHDALYVAGSDGVTIDMSATSIEVAVGGSGDDTFNLAADSGVTMAAGGAGDDIFHFAANEDSSGPVVVWGGDGADQFHFEEGTNILTASVAGLTTENFANFDLDLLGLGEDFDWGAIDAVVINPDANDEFYNGERWDGGSDHFSTEPSRMGISEATFTSPDFGFPVTSKYSLSENGVFWSTEDSVAWFEVHSSNLDYGGVALETQIPVHTSFITEGFWGEAATNQTYGEHANGKDLTLGELSEYEIGRGGSGNGVYIDAVYLASESVVAGDYSFSYGPPQFPGNIADLSARWSLAGGYFDGTTLVSNGSVTAIMPEEDDTPDVFDLLETLSGGTNVDSHTDANGHSSQSGSTGATQ